jgi:hypothetical protein
MPQKIRQIATKNPAISPCCRRGFRGLGVRRGFGGAGFFGPPPVEDGRVLFEEYRLSATSGRLRPFPAAMPAVRHCCRGRFPAYSVQSRLDSHESEVTQPTIRISIAPKI